MEFNYFDLIAATIILLLGLKGIINGFFKELFGLIGIIGGIFIASRVGDQVGQYLSDTIFHFASTSAIQFTGFLFTLVLFWVAMIIVGFVFKKLSSLSGLGPVDKLFGFILGSGKFFLIASVIAFAIYNIQALRSTLDSSLKNSILFPVLVETGKYIMKIDPVVVENDLNQTITNTTDSLKQNIEQNVQNSIKEKTQEMLDTAKEE